MWQGYQPMHQLIIDDILAPGMEQGVFRPADPAPTTGLLMTLYLGIGSTVDEQGSSLLTPCCFALSTRFVLDSSVARRQHAAAN